MSNATLSNPWLIVLGLWGCWLFVVGFVNPLTLVQLVVGFVNPPLSLLWALFIWVWAFIDFIGGYDFKV